MNVRGQNGFSIVETVIAALVLSIGVVGVFSVMSTQKAPTTQTDQRVKAALTAKQFLENLRSKVNAVDYYNGPNGVGALSIGTHGPVGLATYTVNYNVTSDPNGARKVDLNITW